MPEALEEDILEERVSEGEVLAEEEVPVAPVEEEVVSREEVVEEEAAAALRSVEV